MPNDPLDLPATTRRVRAVARAAALPDAALQRGLVLATETPEPRAWRVFLSQSLALLGAGLLLAGVVCFVAYNWDRVGRFGKFALIELAIVGATLLAWRKLPRLAGEIALLSAAVLLGPLLAVFGQTYQTGADPYGLFLTWFVLIIPWVAASRFSAIWILALVLLEVAIVLFWTQVLGARSTHESLYLPLVIAAIDLAALAAWEWQRGRPNPWLTERWAQRLIAVFGLYALWIVAAAVVVVDNEAGAAGVIGLAAFAAAVAGALQYYGHVRADRFMVTVAVTAAMAWVTVGVGRVVFGVLRLEALGLFIMAGLVIWEITLGLKWYRGRRDAA